jgi:hypothetical protein
VIEFLRNAAKRAGVIYDRAASELARQVRTLRASTNHRSASDHRMDVALCSLGSGGTLHKLEGLMAD